MRISYQGSSADSQGRSSLTLSAVGCGDNGVGVQQSTTAEVRATALQTDDEGEVASLSGGSTNNGDRVLGSRSRGDGGGHEASEDCLVLHLDEVLGSDGSECWKRISEWMMLLGRRTPSILYLTYAPS